MLDSVTIYVLSVLFVATFIRSALGFGEALVAVPLLALRTPIAVAAPLAVLVSVLVAATIVLQDWRRIQVRSAGGLIVTAVLGIPFGLLLLARADDHLIRVILGIIIISFSIYSLLFRDRLHLRRDHLAWLIGCGFLSGVLGGAYGMNGPPLAVYGSLRRWSPQHFRATLQGYFLPVSLIGLVGYASLGFWNGQLTRYFVLSLPGVFAAIWLGRIVNERVSGTGFFRAVYVGLIVIGATLLVGAIGH